ncbi:hypothetical protein [Propionispora vibrioides]|uniref:Uncharacterized protein n=1 Tax=Propionispora vibrioides TaxID=112903 RepID=A0A1H8UM23_9FIRM|nr:hypothetical protein [Propionispora vibrioides]SEP04201.1 hypothetical protein SAMN04490178_10937 [Propionispora vibrioides]
MSEWQMVLLAAGILLAANLLVMGLFVLFAKLPDGRLSQVIRGIIYWLDEFADDMTNKEKKQDAIRQFTEVLGWRRILVPAALIGWVIDAEVAAIRKMQAATNTPDLHVEGEDISVQGNIGGTKTTGFKGQE